MGRMGELESAVRQAEALNPPAQRSIYFRFKLLVGDGHYEHDTLSGLAWLIFKHRVWHFLRGDGWVD